MKSTQRLRLNQKQWLNHFGTSIYLLIPTLIIGYFALQEGNLSNLFFGMLIFLGASVFFYWLNWNRLFFQEYKGELNDEQFKRAVRITAKELNWEVIKLDGRYAEALRLPKILGDSSEKITIKKINDSVLINSISNPDLSGNEYSRKKNQENIMSFLVNAKNIVLGEDAEQIMIKKQEIQEEAFWEESEWSIQNILKRIVGYGLVALFLFIGILVINDSTFQNGDALIGIIPILLSIGLGFLYIKDDIKVIIEKRRRKKSK